MQTNYDTMTPISIAVKCICIWQECIWVVHDFKCFLKQAIKPYKRKAAKMNATVPEHGSSLASEGSVLLFIISSFSLQIGNKYCKSIKQRNKERHMDLKH